MPMAGVWTAVAMMMSDKPGAFIGTAPCQEACSCFAVHACCCGGHCPGSSLAEVGQAGRTPTRPVPVSLSFSIVETERPTWAAAPSVRSITRSFSSELLLLALARPAEDSRYGTGGHPRKNPATWAV